MDERPAPRSFGRSTRIMIFLLGEGVLVIVIAFLFLWGESRFGDVLNFSFSPVLVLVENNSVERLPEVLRLSLVPEPNTSHEKLDEPSDSTAFVGLVEGLLTFSSAVRAHSETWLESLFSGKTKPQNGHCTSVFFWAQSVWCFAKSSPSGKSFSQRGHTIKMPPPLLLPLLCLIEDKRVRSLKEDERGRSSIDVAHTIRCGKKWLQRNVFGCNQVISCSLIADSCR